MMRNSHILVMAFFTFAFSALGSAKTSPKKVPASWNQDNRKSQKPDPSSVHKASPWQYAFGGSVNLPELVAFEGFVFWKKFFAMRGFLTPPIPFKIRVEVPADAISAKNGIGVAHPAYTANFNATYGEHIGFDIVHFPYGKSFYFGAGVALRNMRIKGSANSALLLCSHAEVAQEPPCPNEDTRYLTDSKIDISADLKSHSYMARLSGGALWHIGNSGYFHFQFGLAKPFMVKQSANVDANVEAPGASEQVKGALSDVKREKERELESKAVGEMSPVSNKTLPIIGLSIGIRL